MTPRSLTSLRIGLVGPLPPPTGGMANQTRQLAELLRAAGAQVTTVPVNARAWPRWFAGVPVLRAGLRLLPYLAALWRTAGHSDIFHVMANSGWSWHLFATPAVWVARCRGVPVVLNYRGGEAAAFLQHSALLVRFTMRQVTALVVPSDYLMIVFSRFGMGAEVIPNVVDMTRFHARTTMLSANPHLLVARHLEPLYDNATAIRAFQHVLAYFPQARLTIAGGGAQEGALRYLVHAQGIGRFVHFTGDLDPNAMAALYRSADIVLNPSLADNTPNSVLEAWASGVPVVSTNVGGIPHLAQDKINALLVPPSDPFAMGQACIALLRDAATWKKQAQAGQQAAKRHTWSCVQPALLDVYQRALAQPALRIRNEGHQ